MSTIHAHISDAADDIRGDNCDLGGADIEGFGAGESEGRAAKIDNSTIGEDESKRNEAATTTMKTTTATTAKKITPEKKYESESLLPHVTFLPHPILPTFPSLSSPLPLATPPSRRFHPFLLRPFEMESEWNLETNSPPATLATMESANEAKMESKIKSNPSVMDSETQSKMESLIKSGMESAMESNPESREEIGRSGFESGTISLEESKMESKMESKLESTKRFSPWDFERGPFFPTLHEHSLSHQLSPPMPIAPPMPITPPMPPPPSRYEPPHIRRATWAASREGSTPTLKGSALSPSTVAVTPPFASLLHRVSAPSRRSFGSASATPSSAAATPQRKSLPIVAPATSIVSSSASTLGLASRSAFSEAMPVAPPHQSCHPPLFSAASSPSSAAFPPPSLDPYSWEESDSAGTIIKKGEILKIEKQRHLYYILEYRVRQCPLFLQGKCQFHKPFTCFHWHFLNQRRRRPARNLDGSYNYSPYIYCAKYEEKSGVCPDGDDCPYLHHNLGDTECIYHLRYFKTTPCIHTTTESGACSRYGRHCAFGHGADDFRAPIFDVPTPDMARKLTYGAAACSAAAALRMVAGGAGLGIGCSAGGAEILSAPTSNFGAAMAVGEIVLTENEAAEKKRPATEMTTTTTTTSKMMMMPMTTTTMTKNENDILFATWEQALAQARAACRLWREESEEARRELQEREREVKEERTRKEEARRELKEKEMEERRRRKEEAMLGCENLGAEASAYLTLTDDGADSPLGRRRCDAAFAAKAADRRWRRYSSASEFWTFLCRLDEGDMDLEGTSLDKLVEMKRILERSIRVVDEVIRWQNDALRKIWEKEEEKESEEEGEELDAGNDRDVMSDEKDGAGDDRDEEGDDDRDEKDDDDDVEEKKRKYC